MIHLSSGGLRITNDRVRLTFECKRLNWPWAKGRPLSIRINRKITGSGLLWSKRLSKAQRKYFWWFPTFFSLILIGSFSNYDDDHNDDFQKTIGLMIKTKLCTCITLFSTFLWRPPHDYDVKPPCLTFYGGRGHTTTNFPSSFWTWIKSLRIQLQEKSLAFDILSGSK